MKFVVVSDVHIHSWLSYSKLDSNGIPSRLKLYEDLASHIASTIAKNLCDLCVIPGDFLNSPENKPMVLSTAKEFLRIISDQCHVLITDGQHDMDCKNKFINPIHSIASLFKDKEVTYIHDGLFSIEGVRFYVHGWDPEGVLIEESESDSEIYIGHGVVSGSSTPDGFIFKNGISPEKLMSRYRLSIIGDIHNGTTFSDNKGNYVLVPGPPVQNSFRDPETCGYWLIDYAKDIRIEFIKISGAPFHRFVTTDEEISEDEYTHVRRLKTKTSTSPKISSTKSNNSVSDLFRILNTETQIQKPEDPELMSSTISSLLESTQFNTTKNIPETYIKEIEIEGFGNINQYKFNFSSFPTPLLILGSNGCFSGDTSISLLNGKEVQIKDLVGLEEFWVYSCTPNGKVVPGRGHSARLTKIAESLVKVTLDNKKEIKCTPDHKFMMRDGSYKEAKDLKAEDSLMPLYRRINERGYEELLFDQRRWIQTHINTVVSDKGSDKYYNRINKKCGNVVHHKNFDKRDNSPNNLEIMDWFSHRDLHSKNINKLKNIKEFEEKRKRGLKRFFSRINKDKEVILKQQKTKRINGTNIKSSRRLSEYNSNYHPRLRKDITLDKINTHKKLCEKCNVSCLATSLKCSRQKIYDLIKQVNHKVLSVQTIAENKEVYDISVDTYNNFALSSGVFVHNSGKSTLLEAIYWALTGSTTKGLKADKVVNRYNSSGCYVKISLSINNEDVSIVRSRTHITHGTTLFVSKGSVIQKSSMNDTQSLINEMIGITSKVIQTSCYLSARNVSLFGDLTSSEKNDFLSLLSDLEVVEDLRVKVQDQLRELGTKISSLTTKADLLKGTINSLTERLVSLRHKEDKIEDSFNIEDANNKIEISNKEIEKYKGIVYLVEKIEKRRSLLNESIKEIKRKKSLLTNSKAVTIEEKDKLSTSKCYTCGQDILSQNRVSEMIREKSEFIDNLTKEINCVSIEESDLEKELSSIDSDLSYYRKDLSIKSILEEEVSLLEKEINKRLEKSNEEKISKNTEEKIISDQIASLSTQLSSESKTLNEESKKQNVLQTIGKVISRNGSVVKKLLDSSCDELSREINLVLSESSVKCNLSINKEVSLSCLVDNKIRDYEELSSGEKQLIDLAILISFNNLLSRKYGQTSGILGLVALDEVFSYLDPKNAEVAQSIISKSIAKNCLIVTHDYNLQSQFTNCLYVSKENDIANYELRV